MSASGRARQGDDLLPNRPFHPFGDAPHLFGLCLLFPQVSVEPVFRYPLTAVELRDAAPNFCINCISVVHKPPVLLLLRFEEMQQHLLGTGGAGRVNLPLDSGLQGRIMDFDMHGSIVAELR